MRILLIPALLLLTGMASANSTPARDGDDIVCQVIPAEGEVAQGNSATLTPMDDEWQFNTQIKTPTPNYHYEFGPIEMNGREATVDLRLLAPGGMSAQVISQLDITSQFTLQEADQLRIRIDRKFHWGPEEILCPLTQAQP